MRLCAEATRCGSTLMSIVVTTLVIGDAAAAREKAIADAILQARGRSCAEPVTALILEGLPDGQTALADLAAASPLLSIARIAPGCICCTGNLTMRVTLHRILRQQPQRLFISLANAAHLSQIIDFLTQEPYDKLLSLTKELIANSRNSS